MADTVKNLPPKSDLPREKLHRLGRNSLSSAELLAIFLRTGTHDKNVLKLAGELLVEAGSLEALAKMEVFEIMELLPKGIGMAKATALVAAFELGYRAIREEVSRKTLDHPLHVYELLAIEMRWIDQEAACVLLVDAGLNLIRKCDVSLGTLDETIIHPREILGPALQHRAYGFILVHNHPSGKATPSRKDDRSTTRIDEAASLMGIRFVDHVIIGKPDGGEGQSPFYSYRESGRIITA